MILCYSGVAQLRCSLQWQQPFLELVLSCMKSQKAAHDDLLGPLKQQLVTFLAAYEKVSWQFHAEQLLRLYSIVFMLMYTLLYSWNQKILLVIRRHLWSMIPWQLFKIMKTLMISTGLMIMASHQTFSGQIKHMSDQIRFGQTSFLYIYQWRSHWVC